MQSTGPGSVPRSLLACAVVLSLAGTPEAVRAQPHEVHRGNLVLRSSTVSSTAIDPATAQRNGVEPAPGTGILNVTVLRRGPAGEKTIAARVSASRRPLGRAWQRIPLHKLQENGRVSYFGAYDFLPHEPIEFRIRARTASGHGKVLLLTYRQRMPGARPALSLAGRAR